MVSEPARGLFWSNSLISLIDPNIYAFPCCSANIVRTRGFITSPKETSQDAPDESPQDSASSFSLLSPLIPLLSAAFSSSSSSLTSPASPGLLCERSLCFCWGFVALLEEQPRSHLIHSTGKLGIFSGNNSRVVLGFRFQSRIAGCDQPGPGGSPGMEDSPWMAQGSTGALPPFKFGGSRVG